MNGTRSTRAGQKGAPVSKKKAHADRLCGKSHPLTCSILSVWAPKSPKDLPADGDSASRCHMSSYS